MNHKMPNKKWHWFASLLCVVLSAVLLSACGDRFGKAYEEDIYVESPDGQYRLIIQEWGTIGATGAEIYIENADALIPSFTRKKIGNTTAEDCVYPFSHGTYSVEWEDQRVVISYYSGLEGETEHPETWKRNVVYAFS